MEPDVVLVGNTNIADSNPGNIPPQPPAVLTAITNLLAPTEYDGPNSELARNRALHLPSTGNWVFSTAAYQQWHSPDHLTTEAPNKPGILWIRGSPGAGKSVLTSALVDRLRHEDRLVLHFFFRHSIDANNVPEAALRDWLAQVLHHSPPLQAELTQHIEANEPQDDRLSSLDGLFALLRIALEHIPKVCLLLLDGLDEMAPDALDPFLHQLDALARWRPAGMKTVITSRPVTIVEKAFRGIPTLNISLDARVEADIAGYIHHRLEASSIPANDRPRIADAILRRSNGLFLYARLALDHVLDRPDVADAALEAMPAELSAMYSDMLREQASRSDLPPGLQPLVLRCVTYATRPLRLLEIADLVEHELGASSRGDLGIAKTIVRSACGPLLQVLPDETVQVGHLSLTEYLSGSGGDAGSSEAVYPLGRSHNYMALLCLSYLAAHLDDVQLDRRSNQITNMHALPPFLPYSALNWHVHARRAMLAGHDQTETNAQVLALAEQENNIDKLTLLAGIKTTKGLTSIGLATAFNLTSLAREIMAQARLANAQVSLDLALRIAARTHADAEIVKLLLEHGADPMASGRHGSRPLHHAVRRNNHEIAKALLDAGAEPFERVKPWKKPVKSFTVPDVNVFRDGDARMVDLFLKHVKTADTAKAALAMAITHQRHDAIERLLQHPAIEVNAKTSSATPLFRACMLRDARSIEMLLKADADPNKIHRRGYYERRGRKWEGCNALHALAGARLSSFKDVPLGEPSRDSDENTRKCFRLVLDAGVDLDVADSEGRTTLHFAKDVMAVECLLDAGANANAVNLSGETLLHSTMDERIIRALARKVDVNAKSQVMPHRGLTSLLVALKDPYSNKSKIAKAICLLDLGADASAVDDHGNGALHHAVSSIRELDDAGLALLRRLIAEGADVNLKNDRGQTPTHCCLPGYTSRWATRDSTPFLELLIVSGADLEATDHLGRTPLFQMMSSNGVYSTADKIKTAKIMMAAGARMDKVDAEGRNLLHGAMSAPWTDIKLVQFLISHGIGTDDKGNTIWHMCAPTLARAIPKPEYISGLADLGFDRETANDEGIFPIHIVVRYHPCPFAPCSTTYADGRRSNDDQGCFFDYFIRLDDGAKIDVNRADRDGVTPLHIASTFSEYLTRRLLEEGAGPARQTAEGLTVLHLAARSRQTNIAGLLLAWMGSQGALTGVIDLKDRLGRSALWYACASGHPEVVQMLLEAGASVDASSYVGSPWKACVALQDEEARAIWRHITPGRCDVDAESDAGGALISDTLRGRLDLRGAPPGFCFPFPEERLDEIVDLLVLHDCSGRHLDEAITSAVTKGFDHATECLLRARGSLGFKGPYELDEKTSARLRARQEAKQGESHIMTLMADRRYSLATEAVAKGSATDETLQQLVKSGFSKMLGNIFQRRASRPSLSDIDRQPSPLLLVACAQPAWNLNVVRLIAEADPACLNTSIQSEMAFESGLRNMPKGSTALHVLARGGRWWQVEEALPYLLGMGADTEARTERGMTPLAVALESIKGAHFGLRAVEMLLQAGADPNAVDDRGRSCLSMVEDNLEVYQLLLRYRTTISPSAIADMIKLRDVTQLTKALAGGADANARVVPEGPDAEAIDRWKPHSYYPLELVFINAIGDKAESERMLRLLLDNGADPLAWYGRTTLTHQIVDRYRWPKGVLEGRGRLLNMMLQSPKMDLEQRDDKGMTVLHVAAARRGTDAKDEGRSLVQLLIDTGADILARDAMQMTVLHHLIAGGRNSRRGTTESRAADIARVIAAAPELVLAINDQGETPLHLALGESANLENAHALIKAGADVKVHVGSTGDGLLHLLFRQGWVVGPEGDVQIRVKSDRRRTVDATDEADEGADMLQRLLEMGLDVNARNGQGKTPVFGLFERSEEWARDADEARSGRKNPDSDSKAAGREEVIWGFLEAQGVDWTVADSTGATLLHIVAGGGAQMGDFDAQATRRARWFRFLMSRGVDLDAEDEQHRTPLDVAASQGREEMLELVR